MTKWCQKESPEIKDSVQFIRNKMSNVKAGFQKLGTI